MSDKNTAQNIDSNQSPPPMSFNFDRQNVSNYIYPNEKKPYKKSYHFYI